MKKILITTSSFAQGDCSPLELMAQHGLTYILNPYKRKLTEEELIGLVNEHKPEYLIAGTEKISKIALDALRASVKMISRCGVGIDNVDTAYAASIGIPVTNTPDAPTLPVAELALGVMLDVLRRITYTDRSIRAGVFNKYMGSLLHKKTVGLVGCGRIGSHLAHLLSPFECRVIGADPYVKEHPLIQLMPFEQLIAESDVISLHIPYTTENKHIINASVLAKMKHSAVLLNLARGGLVCENDLIDALEKGQIAGAGIDCFENEPDVGSLAQFDNVVLTSHIGSYAKEARLKQELDSVMNIIQVL